MSACGAALLPLILPSPLRGARESIPSPLRGEGRVKGVVRVTPHEH